MAKPYADHVKEQIPRPFEVWLLRIEDLDVQDDLNSYWRLSVEPHHGGPLQEPFKRGVAAIYRTEAEARAAAAELGRREISDSLWEDRPPKLYDSPVAYPVTFIVLMQETGEAKYHPEPAFGGELRWNDDRDVMAIFATYEEAQAYANSMNRAA